MAPCEPWTTPDLVAACAGLDVAVDADAALAAASVASASDLLYQASGRRFSGACTSTVRPCAQQGPCGMQVLSRGHLVWGGRSWRDEVDGRSACSCGALPQIRLYGYPVHSVSEVRIAGDILDPAAYRVDEGRMLVRQDGALWPVCQYLAAPLGEPGTWSVTYDHGAPPPQAGLDAALQLACEIAKAGKPGASGECKLPGGVVRVTRQGVTIERRPLTIDRKTPTATGLVLVDAFLGVYAARRRAAVWTPDLPPAPRRSIA